MLNRVTIMGRMVDTPELRSTASNITVVNFSLAVERDYINQASGERDTDFFDVTAWRGLAEFAAKYLSKGDKVVVDGRLELSAWTGKDGNKYRKVIIVAENIYFASSRRDDNKDIQPSAPAPEYEGASKP